MIAPEDFSERLCAQRIVCQDILALVEKESGLFRAGQADAAFSLRASRKNLLADLSDCLDKIRELRMAWLQMEQKERENYPEIVDLLRENQNLIMRILVMDRENEQTLLRQGLVPPRHMPSANRQRPHFVANMYQRNAAP